MPDKRPGRPRIDDATPARLHVTVAAKDYDRAQQLAKEQDVSVPELLRRGLARVLAGQPTSR